MPAPPSALTLADGETRAVEKTWPDGGYECPFCSSPAAAGGAGCPNPGCRVNMTAAQLAAARGRDEAESAQRRERESIADFAAKQAADRRAAQDALWVELAAEAGRRGSCLQCLRDSDWRGDHRRAKFVRHRRADYHEGTPASAPSAPERPNQTDHRFRHGDRVEYGLSGPGGRDDLGEVVREDRHQTGDGYLIRPLSGTRGDIHRPVWWPAGMVQDETPGRWLLNALSGSYERNPAAGRTGPSGFDRAKADEQMCAVINRNPGWRFEMVNPGNGASRTEAPPAPSIRHSTTHPEGTSNDMSHSGALSPTGGGNVPASGNGYTHGAWRTEMATSVAVCNTITFALDAMEQSLRRLGAGQTQLKWISLCRAHIEATVAEAVPFVGEINRRYDPITQAVAAAGGQAEVADQKTYYQTD